MAAPLFLSFYAEHAVAYGLNEAILLEHFVHWIAHNRNEKVNFREGRTWTFGSVKALQMKFPFWTNRQVHYALESLIKQGVLVTANFNGSKYNRRLWYAFSDESAFLGHFTNLENAVYKNDNSHFTNLENGSDEFVKSETNLITNPDITQEKQGERVTAPAPEVSGSVDLLDFGAPTVTPAIAPDKPKRKPRAAFEPPTLERVKDHCRAKGYSEAQGERFFNFYSSNGWKVGRNLMVSWPHALGNWCSDLNPYRNNGNNSQRQGFGKTGDRRPVDNDRINELMARQMARNGGRAS